MFLEQVNPERIKNMIRDKEELNVLLSYEEQFEDEDIYEAAEIAEEEVFAHFPVLKNKPTLPNIAISYIVIANLLDSVAQQELRNQMRLSDDNVGQIDYSNKSQAYKMFAEDYRQKAINLFQKIAASDYYNSMWGYVPSSSFEIERGMY